MHNCVAGMRIYMWHLFYIILAVVPVASAPSVPLFFALPVCLASSAHFSHYISLTPLDFVSSALLASSLSSALSTSSALSVSATLPTSSALSISLLHTNLANIYYHRECYLSACLIILEPSQEKKVLIL